MIESIVLTAFSRLGDSVWRADAPDPIAPRDPGLNVYASKAVLPRCCRSTPYRETSASTAEG